ncbi:MAG TPA: GYD domain-containing protein [Streptosporangiaceae bacterium]
MTTYAIFFSYSSDAWARMISAPEDRTAAVRQVLGSLDGSLECIYWMQGSFDGLIIADLPDSVSAAAASIAVRSSGAITTSQAHELLNQDQLSQALQRAGRTVQAFRPPGRPA